MLIRIVRSHRGRFCVSGDKSQRSSLIYQSEPAPEANESHSRAGRDRSGQYGEIGFSIFLSLRVQFFRMIFQKVGV